MERNKKEKELLYNWGVQNKTKYHFQEIEKTADSYYLKRETEFGEGERRYIKEYGFETLPEFVKELDALWEDNEVFGMIKKVIGVAAIKNKPSNDIEVRKAEHQERAENQLPSYIYNF